jgi:hypothetical protein
VRDGAGFCSRGRRTAHRGQPDRDGGGVQGVSEIRERGVKRLTADLNYFGLLFESLAVRDIKIYADADGGKVFHYRDSRGSEIDAVVEYADGTWGAFEIKLGIGAVDAAADSLLKFAEKIDTDRVKAPVTLTVLTGNGFAYRRPDGVNVVPISTLTV